MLSYTVPLNSALRWNTTAQCSRIRCRTPSRASVMSVRGEPFRLWSAASTRPLVTSSSRSRQSSITVLPDPDAPTIATISSRPTVRSIPRSTGRSPNDLLRRSVRSSTAGAAWDGAGSGDIGWTIAAANPGYHQ